MDRLLSYSQIQNRITAIRNLGKGYITNFYLSPKRVELYIGKGKLYSDFQGDTLFVIKRENGFFNLYYCSTDFVELEKRLDEFFRVESKGCCVVEVVGNRLQYDRVASLFGEKGFSEYTSLVRMSRITPQKWNDYRECVPVCIARPDQSREISDLLHSYFDEMAEQIPVFEEIEEFIKEKHVLVFEEDRRIRGFLIYEQSATTIYLRYWFVHPEYRDRKIGSALLNRFFYEGRFTKRQIFWVVCSNDNAIKRYKHYGFASEDMLDYVLIRKMI